MDEYGGQSYDLEIKWVGSCIFVVSIVYTFLISRLTMAPPIMPPPDLRRARKLRSMYVELEERKRRIPRRPFPLLELPTELCILILQNAAESSETVASLFLVSRDVQAMAYEACLPRLPVTLIQPHQVEAFDRMLLSKPYLSQYIHHLWVTPVQEESYPAAIRILRMCKDVISVACNGRVLKEAVTSPHIGYRIRHKRCRKLTLLYTSRDGWQSLFLSSSSTLQFMQQITHLRLVGDVIPSHISLPNLAVLSYQLNRNSLNLAHGERMLQDKVNLPSLHSVVLVGERRVQPGGGVRITKLKDTRVFVFEVPQARTELDMWCENTVGRGFWQCV